MNSEFHSTVFTFTVAVNNEMMINLINNIGPSAMMANVKAPLVIKIRSNSYNEQYERNVPLLQRTLSDPFRNKSLAKESSEFGDSKSNVCVMLINFY